MDAGVTVCNAWRVSDHRSVDLCRRGAAPGVAAPIKLVGSLHRPERVRKDSRPSWVRHTFILPLHVNIADKQPHNKTPRGVECFRSTESGIRTLTNPHSASNCFKAARRFKCHVTQRPHKSYPRGQDKSRKSNGRVTGDNSAIKPYKQILPTPFIRPQHTGREIPTDIHNYTGWQQGEDHKPWILRQTLLKLTVIDSDRQGRSLLNRGNGMGRSICAT